MLSPVTQINGRPLRFFVSANFKYSFVPWKKEKMALKIRELY